MAQKKDKIPSKTIKSAELLSIYLTQNSNTDKDRIDTIYSWISNSIDYNYKKIASDKPFNSESSASVLKAKKATCTGYSELLRDMLLAVDISSEIVYGYTPTALEDTIVQPSYDSHSWVAAYIDNNWYLADPTWDAGYIGSIRTNKIPKYKKKWEKLKVKFDKKDKKLETKISNTKDSIKVLKYNALLGKTDDKRHKAEEKLRRSELRTKDYTGKTGFVRSVGKDWFLVEPDSFIVAHLPSNPMWQLKKDTLGTKTFAYGKDSIISYLSKNHNGNYQYRENINNYQKLDILERMLWNAEDAYLFNPNNTYTKAVNYYNYVNILTNKKVQKKIPEKYQMDDFNLLLPLVDTAKTYAKLSVKSEKKKYSFQKKYYDLLNKEDLRNYKKLRKAVDKDIKYNDKAVKNVGRRINSLKKQHSTYEKKQKKLELLVTSTEHFQLEDKIQYLQDSLDIIISNYDKNKKLWQTAKDSNNVKTLIKSITYNRYLVNLENKYYAIKDYKANKYISELDLLIDSNQQIITRIYKDSLPLEMLSKDLSYDLKNMIAFVSYASSELAQLNSEGKIKHKNESINYFNSILLDYKKNYTKTCREAIEHNVQLKYTLTKLNPYIDDIKESEEKQEYLIEDRHELAIKEIGHEKERQKSMFKMIADKSKLWEKDFKAKLKEENN